ncbi:MAG: hypothetical protein ABUS47_02750 [Steroidobacter sp.]
MRTQAWKGLIGLLLIFIALNSFAAIEKIAFPGDEGFDLVWWPKVKTPDGYVVDDKVSHSNAVKMFVLKGKDFADSESVIYAKADYKPRLPHIKSLDEFVRSDLREFHENSADISIHDRESLSDGDGKHLVTKVFTSVHDGYWECVAYGEEGDYFLIFTVSAKSNAGLNSALPVFKKMIRQYHEKQ